MTERRASLIVGNWKMNGTVSSAGALAAGIVARVPKGCEVVLAPPFPLLSAVGAAVSTTPVGLGAQDCHPKQSGAFTGSTSASLLAEFGVRYVIVGHSERRTALGETDSLVAAKALAALEVGIAPIICVGETEAQRLAGGANDVVATQVRASVPPGAPGGRIVVAYEPIWAIGTGRTAEPADVAAMHRVLREALGPLVSEPQAVRLLYGGSVKASNAGGLLHLPNVDGALVGGASLIAEEFLAIAQTAG